MAYTCPTCRRVSHNPNDERERYCGACHMFEADRSLLMPGDYWVLDQNNRPVRVGLMEWATWFEDVQNRTVARTELHTPGRSLLVSTVFLGIDHGFGDPGGPLLFESMTLDDESTDLDCERYRTWDEAMAGHERMAARAKARYSGAM